MGFWSNLKASWRKSKELKRISAMLDPGAPRIDVQWLMQTASTSKKAEEELYDLVENDPSLKEIMRRYGAHRAALRKIYQGLSGLVGGWEKGHWVPASAIAFGMPLAYCLEKTSNGAETSYEIWTEVAYRVNEYFARGEVGRIS
jgi:hypothetical protein